MAVTDIKSGGMVDWIGSFGNVSRDTWQVKRYKETTWFHFNYGSELLFIQAKSRKSA